MSALKKVGGAYLVAVAVAVAVLFIVSPLLAARAFDVQQLWNGLNVLMAVALLLTLAYNYARKRFEDKREPGERITRQYLEVNLALYTAAAVAVLFLHNWFSLLAFGSGGLGNPVLAAPANHQAWVIWAAVDVLLPLVVGITGCALWKDKTIN